MFSLTFALITGMIAGSSACDLSNLMLAIEEGNVDEVKELLNKVDIGSKDESGRSVLHSAVHSNGAIVRLLISRGADKVVNDKFSMRYITNISPLLLACLYMQYGYAYRSQPHLYEIMEAILKAGGDPNVSNSQLQTPLHLATRGPETRLLISYGADVNAKDQYERTPVLEFFYGLRRKNPDVLYALADGNANFAITNEYGDTIFHMETAFNASIWTKEIVILLVRNGVPLDAFNDRGETVLTNEFRLYFDEIYESMTYENFNDSFFAYMAEAGVNLSTPNQHGQTLLHLAVLKHHADMAKWLLDNGAEIEAKDDNGDPPLLALAKWNYGKSFIFLAGEDRTIKIKEVIDVLVEKGADAYFKDEDGHDAAYYLRKWRMTWVDSYIESWLKMKKPKK